MVEKHFKIALYLLSTVMCFMVDFNLIGALIVKDIPWIIDNWLKEGWVIVIPFFILVNYIMIFKHKWMKL